MIFVKYRNGKKLQGILLALGDQSIRVALKGADDAALYRLVSGTWVSEDCEIVTFEFNEESVAANEENEYLEAIFPRQSQPPATQRVM
jgi:hypothetical protein